MAAYRARPDCLAARCAIVIQRDARPTAEAGAGVVVTHGTWDGLRRAISAAKAQDGRCGGAKPAAFLKQRGRGLAAGEHPQRLGTATLTARQPVDYPGDACQPKRRRARTMTHLIVATMFLVTLAAPTIACELNKSAHTDGVIGVSPG